MREIRGVLAVASLVLIAVVGYRGEGLVSAQQQGTKKLVVVSYGGTYQAAQRQAFFQPFAKRFGVEVVEDTGPQIERSRAEVQSGRPSYDLTATNQAFYMIGVEQNLWEPVDYKYFDPSDLKTMPPQVRLQFGVGTISYAEGINFSKQAFPDGGPQPSSWADVWDVRKFPGKRAFPACNAAPLPLPEGALLADGVPADKLYPLDIPRAARKLRELAPNVIWWMDSNQPGQYLISGEATIAMISTGRIQQLIDQGAPLKVVWNQARYTFDVWYVLRGSANKENAMRFLAYASHPDRQAEMARLSGNAPTNPRAYQYIDSTTARKLVTYPDNYKQIVQKDEGWWKANRDKWLEACTAAVLGR